MPFFILSVLMQVALVIHVVKTGRNTTWIWIIVMLPLAGAIAYLILEVLPGASNSRTGKKAARKVQDIINPDRDINRAASDYSAADTVQNSMALARQCLSRNMFQEAKGLYQKCLKGPYANDPDLMFGLASAEFGLNDFAATRKTLDRLIAENPDYKNQDAHLLYARALEGLGDRAAAQHEYETLYTYFTGPQAMFHFALFLKGQGETARAKALFSEVIEKSKRSGRHFNELYKDYINKAKAELSG